VQEGGTSTSTPHHFISPPPAAFTETLQLRVPLHLPQHPGLLRRACCPPCARRSHLLERGAQWAPGTLFPFSPLLFYFFFLLASFFFFETYFFSSESSAAASASPGRKRQRGALVTKAVAGDGDGGSGAGRIWQGMAATEPGLSCQPGWETSGQHRTVPEGPQGTPEGFRVKWWWVETGKKSPPVGCSGG